MRRAASRLSLLIFEPVRSTDHPSICPAATFTRGEPFDDSLCICRAAINNEPLLAWVSVHDPWKKEREEYTCREVYSRCVHCWSCAKRMRVNYILLFVFGLLFLFFFLFLGRRIYVFSRFLRWKPYGSQREAWRSRDGDRLGIVFFDRIIIWSRRILKKKTWDEERFAL